MAITYEWSFPNFETDADNKVKVIHWRYTAVDGEHSATMYGSDGETNDQDFDSMTKEDAIACVLEHSEVQAVCNAVWTQDVKDAYATFKAEQENN